MKTNWKNELMHLEQKKDWDTAISFMEHIILNDQDDMDAYIAMQYLLMNLLVEEEYDDNKHDHYASLLKHYFTIAYKKFSHNAEYLFFTTRTAYISEWYFDMTQEQVNDMGFKAMSFEPDNIIYRWTYIILLNKSLPQNLYYATTAIRLFRKSLA